jgi:hypothetical protein
MAEGGWVVLGATVGTLGSILTTWLNAWLTKEAPDYFDKKAMALLKEILEKGPKWREISYLANIIGLSHEDTKQLLLLIDARGNPSHPNRWGLKSRNPL